MRFEEYTEALAASVRSSPAVAGLVLLGSAAAEARRDEWSDHDFFVVAHPGREAEVRDVAAWLPHPERAVLVAREGSIGFAVLYEDGHLFEFAAASPRELEGALATSDAAILFDDGTTEAVLEASRARAAALPASDAADEAGLALLKILVGVGRARRGERLSAGQFVHAWAVGHLVRAIRARRSVVEPHGDAIDPVRRFERDYPGLATRLAEVLDRPLEEAARGLYTLLRDELELGWDGFPSRAADAVAHRLGWDTAPFA